MAEILGTEELAKLLAAQRPRPRVNLHATLQDPVQKMLVVMRPGEEKPPHANSRELTQVILRGDADMVLYDAEGKETGYFRISPDHFFAYTLPPGSFHTKRVRETLVFFEVMEGPCPEGDVKVLP